MICNNQYGGNMYLITNRINKIFLTIFVFSMLYSGLSAQQIKCITPSPSEELKQAFFNQLAEFENNNKDGLGYSNSVHIVFHIILNSNGTGDITETQLINQMTVLNNCFLGTTISFVLDGVDRTYNSDWANNCIVDETINWEKINLMKQALVVDPQSTFNVYVVQSLGQFEGLAVFPFGIEENNPTHGVLIKAGGLPGGNVPHYNDGKVLVHETGHYFGLYHTFEGFGCDDVVGDSVADTPVHIVNYGCPPESTDTCPLNAGTDPVHNYMNYVYDSCMWEFTPMQRKEHAMCLIISNTTYSVIMPTLLRNWKMDQHLSVLHLGFGMD